MRRQTAIVTMLAVAAMAWAPALAENWAQWRGPLLNGSTPEANLPTKIGPSQGVAWRAKLPGGSGSTPIIWDDRIFISAQDRAQKTWAVCLSRDGGRELWKREIGKGFGNKQGNTGASPSPITDGTTVWFYYGVGDLLAFDMDGKMLWRRNIQKDHGKFEILWDYGASALLHGGKLYVPVIHGAYGRGVRKGGGAKAGGKSYLLCVEPATGRDVWKHARPSAAVAEGMQAYTTPIPYAAPGGTQILVTGADHVTAHDPRTGRELWRSPTYNPKKDPYYRTVVSPVVCGDALVVAAPRGGDLFGGPIGARRWAWTHRRKSPDVPTPLSYKGRFYVLLGKDRTLLCIEPRSGKILGQCRLTGRAVFQASPTGADGKIYCINMRGEAFVVAAGDSPKLLHRADFGGRDVRSTISVSDGQLFVRVDDTLYCVGQRNTGIAPAGKPGNP